MRTGFSFNHKHCSEFGAVMRTVSRPIQPEMKSHIFESPIMDGIYDFSDANSYGRSFYKDRVFIISMLIFADNIYLLQEKLSEMSFWLMGEGVLVFDDLESVEWKAKVINGIDYVPESKGRKAILTVMFNVEPFSFGRFTYNEDVLLDANIPLTAATLLNWSNQDQYFVYSEDVDIPPTVDVFNIGTWYARPKIFVNLGNSSGISISCKGKTLTVIGNHTEEESPDIIIDFENQTVIDKDGNDLSGNVSGEFFELAPGKNTLTLEKHWYSIDHIRSYSIGVKYIPRYIYDFDVKKWEEIHNA